MSTHLRSSMYTILQHAISNILLKKNMNVDWIMDFNRVQPTCYRTNFLSLVLTNKMQLFHSITKYCALPTSGAWFSNWADIFRLALDCLLCTQWTFMLCGYAGDKVVCLHLETKKKKKKKTPAVKFLDLIFRNNFFVFNFSKMCSRWKL